MTDLLAPVVRHIIYPLWMAKDRSPEPRYLRALRRTQFQSSDAIVALQWERLKAILDHAYRTIPFYRERFRRAGLMPADVKAPGDLLAIPPLTKQDIQTYGKKMVSDAVDRSRLITDQTGGSTGAPLVFHYDLDRLASRQAATIRHNEWAGWQIGDKAAVLWAAPRDIPKTASWRRSLRQGLLTRSIILDASALTEAKMAAFAETLRNFRPKIFLAYSNTMTVYAHFVRHRGVPYSRPAAIVCSAELLKDADRRFIEETFECPVFNRYGSREFAVIASECEVHDGMHVNAENLYVECVQAGRHAREGVGELVITDLVNRAMPLIRYRIMDMGVALNEPCPCGRGLPRIDLRQGRVTDFIVTPEGAAVSGVALATYVIPAVPGLRKAQFHQEDARHLTIYAVVENDDRPAAVKALRDKMREFVGEQMDIAITVVPNIATEESGKFRFIKSSLTPETILAAVSRGA